MKAKPLTIDEYTVQKSFVQYMQLQYPTIIINGSLGGVRLPIGLAVKAKNMGNYRSYPDMFIAQPSHGQHGLYLEFKRPGTKLRKRNGDFASDHLAEQHQTLSHLSQLGYACAFVDTLDRACKILDDYLKGYLLNQTVVELDSQ